MNLSLSSCCRFIKNFPLLSSPFRVSWNSPPNSVCQVSAWLEILFFQATPPLRKGSLYGIASPDSHAPNPGSQDFPEPLPPYFGEILSGPPPLPRLTHRRIRCHVSYERRKILFFFEMKLDEAGMDCTVLVPDLFYASGRKTPVRDEVLGFPSTL